MLSIWREYSVIPLPHALSPTAVAKNRKIHANNDLFDLSDGESDSELLSTAADEYSIFATTQKRVRGITRLLEWWSSREIQERYPRLSRMAIDLFTIPAMSDEPERTFSSTGIIITPHRSQLSPEIIGQAQCLKSWEKQGVINLEHAFSKSPALSSSEFSS